MSDTTATSKTDTSASKSDTWWGKLLETFTWFGGLTGGQQFAVLGALLVVAALVTVAVLVYPEVLKLKPRPAAETLPLKWTAVLCAVGALLAFIAAYVKPTPKLLTESAVEQDFVKRPLGKVPKIAWTEPAQSAELQYVLLPAAAHAGNSWLMVREAEGDNDARWYPHPVKVLGSEGRLVTTPFQIGQDADAGKHFSVKVVTADELAQERLESYYADACNGCDWKGILRWPWFEDEHESHFKTYADFRLLRTKSQ